MPRRTEQKEYLWVSELEEFVPSAHTNYITFCFLEKDLTLGTGRKIIEFLERLEEKNVPYLIDLKSLPRCIFDAKQRTKLNTFKAIQREILPKCSKCFLFLRKQCNGVDKKEVLQKRWTIFGSLSVHDVLHMCKFTNYPESEKLRLVLNSILDKMFELKSVNADILYWNYPKDTSEKCDYDFVFHFIEAKIQLREKDSLLNNSKLMTILENTYNKRKGEYIQKENLMPRDNRWTKLIIMMSWLGLLNEEEKALWIDKYASYKFTESEPKLPQAWNRVWVFTEALGVSNVNDLKKVSSVKFSEAKSLICSYVPTVQDLSKQNVFGEAKRVMLSKYWKIRSFCNKPFFDDLNDYLI